MDAQANTNGNDTLTALLFTLPAELRNEIYSLSLPEAQPYVEIRSKWPQLQWLACSKQIFTEAAPVFYSGTPFYAFTFLRGGASSSSARGSQGRHQPVRASTFVRDFDYHFRHTYGVETAERLGPIAANMIKELVVDMRVQDYETAEHLPARIEHYFSGMKERLAELKRLHIFFGPSFQVADPASLLGGARGLSKSYAGWINIERSSFGPDFSDAFEVAKSLVPVECELKWRVSALWNVLDAGRDARTKRRRHKLY